MDKIFNVFHSEPYVGEFYQCSFSTKEKAQQFIDSQFEFADKNNCYINEHIIDAGWEQND